MIAVPSEVQWDRLLERNPSTECEMFFVTSGFDGKRLLPLSRDYNYAAVGPQVRIAGSREGTPR